MILCLPIPLQVSSGTYNRITSVVIALSICRSNNSHNDASELPSRNAMIWSARQVVNNISDVGKL